MKKATTLWQEFKDFAIKGNAIELAIGLIIGQAFTKIVNSLVTDIILPPLGWLLGNVDLSDRYILLKAGTSASPPYASLQAAKEAGAITLNVGLLINSIINFLIIAWVLFWVVRALGRLRASKPAPAPASTKECPYCLSTIALKATRCPYCTSILEEPAQPAN